MKDGKTSEIDLISFSRFGKIFIDFSSLNSHNGKYRKVFA